MTCIADSPHQGYYGSAEFKIVRNLIDFLFATIPFLKLLLKIENHGLLNFNETKHLRHVQIEADSIL